MDEVTNTELAVWQKLFGGKDTVKYIHYVDLQGSYCGNGAAIAQVTDGTWSVGNYSHCSCFGPEESTRLVATGLPTKEEAYRHLGQTDLEDMQKYGAHWP